MRRRSPALELRPFGGVVAASGGEWGGSANTHCRSNVCSGFVCGIRTVNTSHGRGWGLWCIDGGERRDKGLWVGTLVY